MGLTSRATAVRRLPRTCRFPALDSDRRIVTRLPAAIVYFTALVSVTYCFFTLAVVRNVTVPRQAVSPVHVITVDTRLDFTFSALELTVTAPACFAGVGAGAGDTVGTTTEGC